MPMIETSSTEQYRRTPQTGAGYDVLTLVMLLFGGFVVPVIGWAVAVVMAWNLPRWTTGQKWLATLIWPVALVTPIAALVLTDGFNTGAGGVVAVSAIAFAVLAVPLATTYLGLAAARARRAGL